MSTIHRLIYLSVLFQFLNTTAYSANHYVNKNANGANSGTSWINAWESFADINWASVLPGDFVYISGGSDSTVYYEVLQPRCRGTATNRITIIAGKYSPSPTGHSGRVIIDGGNGARAQSIFFDEYSSTGPTYITVKGFECRRGTAGVKFDTDAARGVTKGIILDSLFIYDFYDLAGVLILGNADSTVIQNCTIKTFVDEGGQTDCIHINGAGALYPILTVIHDNVILNMNQDPLAHNDAIQSVLADGFVIYNNIVVNDSVNSPEGGGMPFILSSTDLDYNDTPPVIAFNNFLWMGGTWWPNANAGAVFRSRHDGIGFNSGAQSPNMIFNNTFVCTGPRVAVVDQEWTIRLFINNIVASYCQNSTYWNSPYGWFANLSGGSGYEARSEIDSFRTNCFWRMDSLSTNGGQYQLQVGGWMHAGTPVTIGSWANWVNYEPNSLFRNPNFVSNFGKTSDHANLKPDVKAGSPVIGAGESISYLYNYIKNTLHYDDAADAMLKDIYGNPRNIDDPSIGAYEYQTGGGNNPPNQPSNPNPVNGASNQPVTLTMTWSCIDPDGDPLSYDVYFGTNNNPPLISGNQSNASYNPGQLNNNTSYYWKIIAKDNQGYSTSGSVWSFSTETGSGGNNPPNPPSNPNPVNGAIEQSVNLVMNWSCTDPNGDPLTYDVYFGTSNNPPLLTSNQTNTSYNPGQLNTSTTYYWKIDAKDNQGASTSGPIWSFSTETSGGGDFIPPELVGVQIVEADKVVLDFSEPLDESQVSNLENFIISDQIQVLSAELNPTQTRICLTTDDHLVEHIYTIEIHNLTDLAGNVISSQSNSAFYKKLDIGAPGYKEHLIEYVGASATTDTNTSPQKTLDGLVNSDPDPNSRWAAEIMPQWIQFDLGAIEDINLIAISFYQWNAGRIYEYSIQISNDENDWNEIISNASSSSQAWTFIDFSPVLSTRYIRIICESNNQSNWAGLWEARIFEPDYPTSVEIEPRTYVLKQNYPNPFNPITAIEYYVPQLSWVRLLVYNSIGQEIEILVDEEKASGLYEVKFNAVDLPSGIYFYKFQSVNFVETKKMVLLK